MLLALSSCVTSPPAHAETSTGGAAGAAATPTPHEGRVHDHVPRHGGTVGMSGTRHLEALALAQGVVRVYVTDFARSPLPLDGVHGTATVKHDGADTRLELLQKDGALEAHTAPFTSPTVDVRIEIVGTGEPLLIDFSLPVEARPVATR